MFTRFSAALMIVLLLLSSFGMAVTATAASAPATVEMKQAMPCPDDCPNCPPGHAKDHNTKHCCGDDMSRCGASMAPGLLLSSSWQELTFTLSAVDYAQRYDHPESAVLAPDYQPPKSLS